MKLRNVKNKIIRQHLRRDARNLKNATKFIKTNRCTVEQLELYKISIPLTKWLMKLSNKYLLLITIK